jgi:hypothetical protein
MSSRMVEYFWVSGEFPKYVDGFVEAVIGVSVLCR